MNRIDPVNPAKSCKSCLTSFVNDLAVNHRHYTTRFQDLRLRNLHDIGGTIEVGKLADLTILSADIMTIPAPEILKTRCVMTVINGEMVFAAD